MRNLAALVLRAVLVVISVAHALAPRPAFAQLPPRADPAATVAAPPPSLDAPPPSELAPRKRNDPAMMVAGIVITSLGIASVPIGVGFLVGDKGTGTGIGIPTSVPGWFILSLGSTFLPAIGIPLWVNGAKPRAPSPDAVPRWSGARASIASWALPTVAPGLGSVALRWTF